MSSRAIRQQVLDLLAGGDLAASRRALAGLPAGDLLLVNDDDLTYVKTRLDPVSLATVIAPDGGVISHRFHNPVAINPFMAFFDVRRVREAIERTADTSDRFAPDLIGHWPSQLVRVWDGKVAYPRIRVVLDEGYVPYGTALDNFEPYYSLEFRLLRAGLEPMYLSARDAPEMDDDGCCTALLGRTGRVMAYHSWFARSYGYDREQTVRINKVVERSRSHVRW